MTIIRRWSSRRACAGTRTSRSSSSASRRSSSRFACRGPERRLLRSGPDLRNGAVLMSKSPGHQQHPDHRVAERHLDQRMTVTINGEVIADSRDVIEVDEDRSPARFYFPRTDVKMDKLQPTSTTSQCPYKG